MNGLTFRAELQRELTLRPFSLQRFLKEPLGCERVSLKRKTKSRLWRRWNRRHDRGTATFHSGKYTFRQPSRSSWLVSIPAGISGSVPVRSASTSREVRTWSAQV